MESNTIALALAKSKKKRYAKLTAAQLHRVLGHPSPKVVEYIENAVADVTIDHTDPTLLTIKCKLYSVSKATQVILRRTKVDEPENGIPFDRTI